MSNVRPHMLRLALSTIALATSFVAHAAAGLGDLRIIDRVIIEKSTGQSTLVLLVDLPLEQEDAVVRTRQKLDHYKEFVVTGQLYSQFPLAKREQPVQVLLFHESSASSRAAAALKTIEKYSGQLQMNPVSKELGSKEPLIIPSASAASDVRR